MGSILKTKEVLNSKNAELIEKLDQIARNNRETLHISQSEIARNLHEAKSKEMANSENNGDGGTVRISKRRKPDPMVFGNMLIEEPSATINKFEKQQKKKRKKKHKKDKKELQKEQTTTGPKQIETTRKFVNGKVLARGFSNEFVIKVIRKGIYIYDKKKGCFKLCDKQSIQTLLTSWIESNGLDPDTIPQSDLDEAYKALFINAKLQCEEISGAYNKPYVLCENGVLDVENMTLLKKSPDYEFTNAVNASFDTDAEGPLFKQQLEFVTQGDKSYKKRLQEVMGYALSNYVNIRTAFVYIGPKGSGKSLYLDVIRNLVGVENTSAVNIQDIENEYYVSKILEKKMNIAPDIPAKPIKGEISKFKSLTSDLDVISGRNPYEEVKAQRSRTKFYFGSNNHFTFSGISKDDIEAFFDRMMYLPFRNVIPREERIYGYAERLQKEYNYIFTWAMKGLKRLIENNFVFTPCEISEKEKEVAMAKYCPEQVFFDTCIKQVESERYESSRLINDAFKEFCAEKGSAGSGYNIISFLEEQGYHRVRKRVNEEGFTESSSEINPTYVFEGIRLKKRYRE